MIKRKRKQNKRYVRSRIRIEKTQNNNSDLLMQGFGSSGVLLLFCVIIIIGFYTYVTNASSLRGVEIHKLEEKIAQTESEYKELSILVAELSTIESAEKLIKEKNMKQIIDVEYITIKEEGRSVASKDF